jgi:penicillin-binding protein 1C
MTRHTLRRAARWCGAAVAVLIAAGVWIRCGPLPDGLLDRSGHVSTVVLDRHGEVLYEARSADGTRGEWIAPGEMPEVLAAATLAAEDRRFRFHVGLDPRAIARAAWRNLRARAIVEGGSTISQQVAQLLLTRQAAGTPRRGGWLTQLTEAVLALRLEHHLGKDEILSLYLNLAPYGNQITGIERAARAYFGSAAPDAAAPALTPAEAAFLAALPQQPTRYNPWRDPKAAIARQRRILRTMAADGWLEAGAYRAALDERLTLRHEAGALVAPHFVERVLSEAGGEVARLDTTLDATLQRTAQGIIAAHRADLEAHGAANVAVVVLDNRRGEWLVWEGSGNYADTTRGGAIDGVITPRQPGSALKPFTYAAAFERGAHPGTVLADVPSQFPTIEPGILYSPRNYDGRFRGPLRARDALAGSENVPAVALASAVGVPVVARLMRSAGLTTLDRNADHYGLGLTLGNAEVRLDELVSAYAAIARGGLAIRPRKILATGSGDTPQRVMASRTAFWIADILSDADARAYAFGRGGSLEFPFTVAAKTGTSQAYHDNWAIGFTQDVTVGVWVGNFDRRPLRSSSGVTGAAPILHDLLLASVSRVRGELPIGDFAPIVLPTSDVRRETLCAVSGMAAATYCVRRVSDWVPVDEPIHDCTWHHHSERGLVTIWPEEYRNWARSEGLIDDERAVEAALESASSSAPAAGVVDAPTTPSARTSASGLTIAAPLAGATYLIDPTLRPEFQALPLQARGAPAGTSLEWRVDGVAVGTIGAGLTLRWPLSRGRHVIAVVDASGRRAETTIEVR